MRNFFTIAFFVVLAGCSLLAIRIWYARRGANVPEPERRVFTRFVLGLAVFWLFAVAAYLAGYLSFSS